MSEPGRITGEGRLPGDPDPRAETEAMIRVDHAGEYGAVRIYEGQRAVLGRSRAGRVVGEMEAQERRHLAAFDELVAGRRVRPSALLPLWHVAGFALGAATALMGPRAAMACTVAVEEVIDAHYSGQSRRLGDDEQGLRETIEGFRDEELAHRATALSAGAEEAPGYPILSGAIKAASRLAIALSTRL